MVLSKFMDELCDRGYEVFAITSREKYQWKPGLIYDINTKINESRQQQIRGVLHNLAKKYSRKSRIFASIAWVLTNRTLLDDPIEQVKSLTERLIQNWVQSEVTISTYCMTSFATYALMDKTRSIYHMQSNEELFFDDIISKKLARLSYYLPLTLISNSSWLRRQIRDINGRDLYLLNPGN